MLWVEPLCDETCNISVSPFDLTLDQLEKVNEYRMIKSSYTGLMYKNADTG